MQWTQIDGAATLDPFLALFVVSIKQGLG